MAQRSRTRLFLSAVVLVTVGATGLSGCSLLDGPKPKVTRHTQQAVPKAEAKLVPNGDATDNKPYFTKIMHDFGKSKSELNGENMMRALETHGFVREHMQVAQDETPLHTPPDSYFVSVRYGSECLISQVVAEGRQVFVTQQPTVGPDQDQCLVVPKKTS